jgi:hypothetical protein
LLAPKRGKTVVRELRETDTTDSDDETDPLMLTACTGQVH